MCGDVPVPSTNEAGVPALPYSRVVGAWPVRQVEAGANKPPVSPAGERPAAAGAAFALGPQGLWMIALYPGQTWGEETEGAPGRKSASLEAK